MPIPRPQLRLLLTWLVLLAATTAAYMGEARLLREAAVPLILGVAWLKLDRIMCVFMELEHGPRGLHYGLRLVLVAIALSMFGLVRGL